MRALQLRRLLPPIGLPLVGVGHAKQPRLVEPSTRELQADGETIGVPAFPVEVVSTLGAGDVFHGALLACLARGLPLRDAAVRANACAALSCRALDGRSAIPDWDELERSVVNAAG